MCKEADAAAERYGVNTDRLMENAAFALYDNLTERFNPYRVVILCGNGNNGGDGYALASIMLQRAYDVVCVKVLDGEMSPLCRKRFSLVEDYVIDYCVDSVKALRKIDRADVIVDCIFGTGFRGELPESVCRLSEYISGKKVVACDIPSGLYADNGIVTDNVIKADLTVTFAFYKPCFFMTESAGCCGEVVLADIGMPAYAVDDQEPWIRVIEDDFVGNLLEERNEWGHKGTFGSVQLICGSDNMTGAAIMSERAALKSGVGLTYLTTSEKAKSVIQSVIPEAVYLDRGDFAKVNSQLIGPGIGRECGFIEQYLQRDIPTVIDADGINYLSGQKELLGAIDLSKTVLTPHPLEMARLLDETVENVESNRFDIASDFSMRYGCVLVLKGHRTIVATPDGNIYVNMTGNSGLSKGGSGDVLSGYIAGLLARGYDPWKAAVIGVFFHGRAADRLVENGMSKDEILPDDIIGILGKKELLIG